MLQRYIKRIYVKTVMIVFVFLTAVYAKSARAEWPSYTPSLADSAYSLSFVTADENNHNLMTYENINGQWQKEYYNYVYQIKNCPDNNCSSNNRFVPGLKAEDINSHFYGIEKSGAVYNSKYKIGQINADFIKNSSYRGAAVYNKSLQNERSEIGDLTGDFIGNVSDSSGGAVFNDAQASGSSSGAAIIGDIKGNFIGNTSGALGGAVYNSVNNPQIIGQIGNIEGDFIANKAQSWGGAVFNQGTIGNISGNFINNIAGGNGGAVMSNRVMGSIRGDFIANSAGESGGALHFSNYTEVGHIEGLFIGNTAVDAGGAVYSASSKDLDLSGEFINNHADYGGAVYNSSLENVSFPMTSTITNSSFINNSAGSYGGAIYHRGIIDIAADNYASVFQGNTAGGVSNAILVETGTVNLTARNKGSITFYDDIDGNEGYGLTLTGDADGRIDFHANINNGDIAVGNPADSRAVPGSTNINFDSIDNIGGRNNSLVMNSGKLTFGDFASAPHHFRELRFNGGEIHINNVDVDLVNTAMGKFDADSYAGGNTLVKVHHVNVLTDGDEYTAVDFADMSFANQVESNVNAAKGPVYDYDVAYLPGTGQFAFQRAAVNPDVTVPSYAAVAAVSVLSDEIYSRVLADADSYFGADTGKKGLKPFVKVFGSDDNIDLKNFSGGKSNFYGLIAGAETSPTVYASGWKSVYNTYLAYAQGEHKFSSQKVDQESGYIGASGIFYKDKFFIGSTLNAAVMENKSKEGGEKNKFTSYLAGIGLKTGYNIDLGSDYTLQPNLYGSYTYIKSNDYKTKLNARVKFHDMSNFELAPGLKLTKKFADGMAVYLKGRYVLNFNEHQDAKANDVILPDAELKNYAEFGVGMEKNWIEKDVNLFFEITRREGGREGWNGLAGIKWAF